MSEVNLREKLFRVVDKAGKIANGLKIAAIPILVLNLIVSVIGFYYFLIYTDMGHWSWGIPTLIMILPLLSVAAVLWILDTVASVPKALRSSSADFGTIIKHHRKKLEMAENGKMSKFKYLKLVGRILWEATDIVDGVGMAAFVSTPVFWFLYLCTFLGSFIFGAIMLISIVIHYIMS